MKIDILQAAKYWSFLESIVKDLPSSVVVRTYFFEEVMHSNHAHHFNSLA